MLKKLVLALAVLVALFMLVEIGLRTFRPVKYMQPEQTPERDGWYGMIHRASSVPGLAYELVPKLDQQSLGVHVVTNSLGMRDHEPLANDTPGLVRILALGDSVTFGYRVEAAQSFCKLLEQNLIASPPLADRKFEVLDTGVSGYSSRDEIAAFEGKWLALKPKLVLLDYILNDPEIEPMQPLQRYFVAPHWWQHSHLLRWVVQHFDGRKVQSLGGGDYFRYLHAPSEPSWKSVEAAFARLAELARANDFRVALVIFPMLSPKPWSEYAYREQHAQVAREGAKNGFVVLDLLPRFEKEDPESLLIVKDDMHPNPKGHTIIADELRKLIDAHPEFFAAR